MVIEDGDAARRDLRPAQRPAAVGRARRRRPRPADRVRHPQGRAALDDLPTRRRRQRPAADRRRGRHQRRPGHKAKSLLAMGADVLVIDTAHGHQTRTLRAIEEVRAVAPTRRSWPATSSPPRAHATSSTPAPTWSRSASGPGAMCTTRMMTGVGRPQFSAVLECAAEAASHGKHIWADGGVRYPARCRARPRRRRGQRDVRLVARRHLRVGGRHAARSRRAAVQGELRHGQQPCREDPQSHRDGVRAGPQGAVRGGHQHLADVPRPDRPGVEDIIDEIVAGVRSACTYAGAATIAEFHERAVVGVQSAAGYSEGLPQGTSW